MITFVASPTGGHIYPAIACAQELGSSQASFISVKSPTGSDIITRYGFKCHAVLPFRNSLYKWPIVTLNLLIRLLRKRPKVLVLCGGYLCVPVGLLALILRIPLVILEQNVLPGRANRLFGRFATNFCSSFPSTQQHLRTPCTYTGNPIRKTFPKTPLSEAITSEPWPQSPIIGIFGGSQGARYINQWIHSHQTELNDHQLTTFHITGTRDYDDALSTHESLVQKDGYAVSYRADGRVQTLLLPYLEDMELFYSIVSLVISRAGASTIAELIHFQTPAITISYPYAKDKHQDYNARELENMGLGTCIFEPKLTFKDLQHALSHSYSLTQEAPNARESICKLLTQF